MDRITITDRDAEGITINGKPIVKPAKVTKSLEEVLADVKNNFIEPISDKKAKCYLPNTNL